MKSFVKRFLLPAAIVLLASLAALPARTQQLGQSPWATVAQESDFSPIAAQHANEAQMPASGEATTQEVKSFVGIIMNNNNAVTLQDPVSKVSYRLNDPSKARPFVGKRVKITGKLETQSNTILMEGIEIADSSS
jgi:hypothetical protein